MLEPSSPGVQSFLSKLMSGEMIADWILGENSRCFLATLVIMNSFKYCQQKVTIKIWNDSIVQSWQPTFLSPPLFKKHFCVFMVQVLQIIQTMARNECKVGCQLWLLELFFAGDKYTYSYAG